MTNLIFSISAAYTEEEKVCFTAKYIQILSPALSGNTRDFDEMCNKILPFCEELYQIGHNRPFRWKQQVHENAPCDSTISGVFNSIQAYIMPHYRSYRHKSEAFCKMVFSAIAEEKYGGGRLGCIRDLWPQTKRIDGVDVHRLLSRLDTSPNYCTAIHTVWALLKFRNGDFVEEVKELQKHMPKDEWITHRKKITLYIERYGQ